MRFPTYQLDRAKLDTHLLELAAEEGCTVIRKASVKTFELNGAGNNLVTYKHEGETRTVKAAWVADCSGKAALIARKHACPHLDHSPPNSAKQVFSDWKSDKKPTNKMVWLLDQLATIGGCPVPRGTDN